MRGAVGRIFMSNVTDTLRKGQNGEEQSGQGHHSQKHLLLSKSYFYNKQALIPKCEGDPRKVTA
jgi:hypothetical protein